MRYGNPSTGHAIDRPDRPRLRPHPAAAALSAIFRDHDRPTANDQAFRALMRLRRQPAIRTAPSFPEDPAYIKALATGIRRSLAALDWTPELLIASFHGLPVDYVQRGDPYPTECARTIDLLRA